MKQTRKKEDLFFLCQNGDTHMILKKMGLVGAGLTVIQVGLCFLNVMFNMAIFGIIAFLVGSIGGGLLGAFVATNLAETNLYKKFIGPCLEKCFGRMLS